jgi:probable rRNA maturation factor
MPEARIRFLSELATFKLPNPRKTAQWLKSICETENQTLDSVTYVFCTDNFLLSLNRAYLKHSTYTDILSFDYSDGEEINGEIYISVERVRENAGKFKQPFDRELRRVIAHGMLHFLGYDDKGPRQKAQMRRKEEACLSLWK